MKETGEKGYDFGELAIENFCDDNGKTYEVFMPKNLRDRLIFSNDHCEFKPVGWIRTEVGWLPLGYKVVTDEMKSLGLRKNPTIMKFSVGEWAFEKNELQYGDADYGGIWTALRKGSIRTLRKHCMETWDMRTRGFLTAIYNPVAIAGNYRIKSEGVMLLKEIKPQD